MLNFIYSPLLGKNSEICPKFADISLKFIKINQKTPWESVSDTVLDEMTKCKKIIYTPKTC